AREHPRALCGRQDDRAHHALSRGGRSAGAPHRRDRSRRRHRRCDAARDQVAHPEQARQLPRRDRRRGGDLQRAARAESRARRPPRAALEQRARSGPSRSVRARRGHARSRGDRRRPGGGVPQHDEARVTTAPAASLLRMLLAQTRSELLMRSRVPAFSVTNLILPIVFFTFFGLPVAHLVRGDGVSIGAYLLASFGAYAVGNVMVYGFGIGVANERGMKIDRLMRASPLPPLVFMLAKVVTALVFSLVALVL